MADIYGTSSVHNMDEPTSFVELSISCKNLPRLDVTSKSDPFVVFYMIDSRDASKQFKEIGRTEMIKDNQDPKFSKQFIVQYFFERSQKLKFVVYDCDSFSDVDILSKQQYIGEIECDMADIVGARGQVLQKPLLNPKHKERNNGTIVVSAEEVNLNTSGIINSTTVPPPVPATLEEWNERYDTVPQNVIELDQFVEFQCSASNLDKKDFLGKSDPYFRIYRSREEGESTALFESETIKKDLNPQWKSFSLPLQKLCNYDMNRTLIFEVWDWDKHSSHDLIGRFETSLEAIINNNKKDFAIIHPEKKVKKKNYENSGIFHFNKCQQVNQERQVPNPAIAEWMRLKEILEKEYYRTSGERRKKEAMASGKIVGPNPFTFLDYVAGGCEISVFFGIDYTASNGSAESSSSLHHLDKNKLNPYQQAITAVGNIVAPYDHDQNFPVYGYGAYVENNFPPLFFANHGDDPNCHGIDGVLEAYSTSVQCVRFGDMGSAKRPDGKPYRGDDFYQLIKEAIEQSKLSSPEEQKYNILLLIIDGDMFDDKATIDTIIEAEDYPLSVIIVGVGNSSFSSCKRFDADDEPLVHSSGRVQRRDIVQFVKMNSYKNDPEGLAAEVLAEVPKQLTSYMAMKNIFPRPKVTY